MRCLGEVVTPISGVILYREGRRSGGPLDWTLMGDFRIEIFHVLTLSFSIPRLWNGGVVQLSAEPRSLLGLPDPICRVPLRISSS